MVEIFLVVVRGLSRVEKSERGEEDRVIEEVDFPRAVSLLVDFFVICCWCCCVCCPYEFTETRGTGGTGTGLRGVWRMLLMEGAVWRECKKAGKGEDW